jgi:acetyl-CoA carboxylase biotin carboxylase subunit
VRVDDGFEEGMDIPIYYDPMIAKLITWGENREQSIQRMIRAIDEYIIVGCETTLPFGKFVMQHEAFVSGNFDTHFVKHFFTPEKLTATINESEAEAAALVAYFLQNEGNNSTQVAVDATNKRMGSAWKLNRS